MFKLDVIKAITSVKIGSVQHVKLRLISDTLILI
jgi:hypothetical protein